MNTRNPSTLDVYLDEYTRGDIIARYITETAGAGIAFLLAHVYAPLYASAIRQLIAERPTPHPFRVLEYGCGGGMNLLKIVELLRSEGAELETAFGADFSAPMIDAARQEAARRLPPGLNAQLTYVVANNESLSQDLARNLSVPRHELLGSFDLIVGVNTFRYCHRLHRQNETAQDIRALLRPGGYSIMIDMNRHFPFFRSKLRNILKRPTIETYVPSLREYAQPFADAGFQIHQRRNFCWIPHSANRSLLSLCRALAPVLDTCCPAFAMRSLVVAQKPR